MEIEILREFDNPLIGRKEYTAKVVHEGASTPKRLELRKTLAAQVNADTENTVLIEIGTHFGITYSTVIFHVYDATDQLTKIENKYILKRNSIIE